MKQLWTFRLNTIVLKKTLNFLPATGRKIFFLHLNTKIVSTFSSHFWTVGVSFGQTCGGRNFLFDLNIKIFLCLSNLKVSIVWSSGIVHVRQKYKIVDFWFFKIIYEIPEDQDSPAKTFSKIISNLPSYWKACLMRLRWAVWMNRIN